MNLRTFQAGLALVLLAAGVTAQADDFNTDRKGGADHPLVSRYKGSILYMFGAERLGQASLLVAGQEQGKPAPKTVEGRVSNHWYLSPSGVSPLEVFRNYQQALTKAGYQVLYTCTLADCEKFDVQDKVKDFPRTARWAASDVFVDSTFNSGNQRGFNYLSVSKSGPDGVTYIQLATSTTESKPISGRARLFLQIVEPQQMEGNMVTVGAKAINEGLQRDGKIALYGVQFDTNKAEIRAQSAAQLKEMADALKAAPKLKVYIVGHTDSDGDLEANLLLSQKRAQAVVAALSKTYGIAADRLNARGVASLAPVASNAADAGKARNRRVEMVVR
jgi:outer membrane protein OmpA-like peptidoglycan-associated protein